MQMRQRPAFCILRDDGHASFRAAKTPGASICSLTPAATQILYALGLRDRVIGVSDACEPVPVGSPAPTVVATRTSPVHKPEMSPSAGGAVPDATSTSLVTASGSAGPVPTLQPYAWWAPHVMGVDVEWLRRERPGLVITQDAVGVSGGDNNGDGDSGHGAVPHVVLRALVEARLVGPRAMGGSTVLLVRSCPACGCVCSVPSGLVK
jgi:hypothetical protein